jgi:hypothetical protein
MVGEPTTYTRDFFDAFGPVEDATPLLVEARAIKTEQEIERLRLANELAAEAMEHVRGLLRPGMKESEVGALWEGYVHGAGTGYRGQVTLARGFSLSGRGQGSGRSPRRARAPWSRASRRCSRSGSAATAIGPITRRTSAPASWSRGTRSSRRP